MKKNPYYIPVPVSFQNSPVPTQPTPDTRPFYKLLRRAGNRNGLLLFGLVIFSNLFSFLGNFLLTEFVSGKVSDELYHSLSTLVSFSAMYAVAVPVLLLLNRIRRKHYNPLRFVRAKVSGGFLAKWTMIGFGCAYAVNYVFNIFFLMIQMARGFQLQAPNMLLGSSWLDGILTVTFFAIAAPLCEELFFRGSLLGNIRSFGGWFSICMTALMFGMTHMNYQQLFYTMAMGIIAGFVCMKAQSILPGILLHFCLNAVGAIQTILLSQIDLEAVMDPIRMVQNIGPMTAVFGIAFACMGLAVAGVILLIIELVKRRGEMRLENGCPALSGRKKAIIYLTAPATLLYLLFTLIFTVLNAVGFSF